MRRRTFLAALPAAAAAPLLAQTETRISARPQAAPDNLRRPDLRSGDRPVGASYGSRSAVYGSGGAAASAQPLATLAGIEILKAGGSAADAAIAINACLGFLEPTSCGIGGDLYAMLWSPAERKVVGVQSSGRSPRGLSLDTVRSRARPNGTLPPLGAVSVSVPGTVAGWQELHRRYGKLPWHDVLAPAIAMAEEGRPMAPIIAYYVGRSIVAFRRANNGIEETENAIRTYAPGGNAPNTGEIFRNADLARTYRAIAEGGADAFYDGEIAATIERYFRRIGGWMTRADLRAHRATMTDPITTDYRGVTVHAIGENTQGVATLQILNMLETFDMAGAGFQSARSIHLGAEAKRLAFEDRARFYADPTASPVPFAWLASKDYARERARLIRPDRINPDVRPGNAPAQGDTTYLTAADKDGMMVSLIQSNFRGMGSGLVPDGLGFMFQDRGQLFSLQDGHPNIYAPGKRPFQTIIPGFATKDGTPWMSFGVMGGAMQPQGQAQVLMNMVDHGLDVQAAGDAPRWRHEGSSESMGEDDPDMPATGLLHLEAGVPDAVRAELERMGWSIGRSDGGFGRYHNVERLRQDGPMVYAAASDPRADGAALAY
ncbi:gamma-glutamyltranspeptidase/glutathione hydrolase [Sphingomonas jejuensis]|uniref:Gamma-glutamyltranspeptidase/glutathione hydrolase n=1 Tax=Sphingomonas jejuensis TaxID=904715 RepID=A0ABX0XJ51_9SPHN|nr:gamma-glutamyltransferase family protein [Sphingomonas jejuensis]NJC33270.1 gamma-glutamyltranspeptidase/glutathione hydrolase [Sphingomonas jejuensis]